MFSLYSRLRTLGYAPPKLCPGDTLTAFKDVRRDCTNPGNESCSNSTRRFTPRNSSLLSRNGSAGFRVNGRHLYLLECLVGLMEKECYLPFPARVFSIFIYSFILFMYYNLFILFICYYIFIHIYFLRPRETRSSGLGPTSRAQQNV